MVLFVGGLTISCVWVVRPFIPATIWAVAVVMATWPLLPRLERVLWHRRGLAVLAVTLLVLMIFVVPIWLAASEILGHADDLRRLVVAAVNAHLPPPPAWVHSLPLIGSGIAAEWTRLQASGLGDVMPRLTPYAGRVAGWFVGALSGFGFLLVQLVLVVVIAAVIQMNGERAGAMMLRLGRRVSGERGEQMVVLAGHAVRAVAIGVMVTALVESAVGGLGLAVAGVPLPGLLTAVMFVFCLAQAGPGVVLIPAVIFMYVFRNAGLATVLLAISAAAITIDNVLRPFLIRKEADLPILLVLVGVIGGLLGFGLIGVIVGPVALAVAYTVLRAWMAEAGDAAGPGI